jgi:predicted nucleotidyltransferase
MPNLTLHLDAALLKAAKVYAAQHDTSISELVRQHLAALTRATDGEIAAQLAAEKPRIEALALKRGFRNLRIFGSVARGEADDSSDVDLLVDAARGTSLIDLIGLQRELQDLLGRKVDVVTPAGLPQDIRTRALAEAKPL